MLVDSASPDREKCGFTSDVGASFALVNQLQRQLSGVAVPSENASRLIADVWESKMARQNLFCGSIDKLLNSHYD